MLTSYYTFLYYKLQCQLECACLHQTKNIVIYTLQTIMKIPNQKRESTYANIQSCPFNKKRESDHVKI